MKIIIPGESEIFKLSKSRGNTRQSNLEVTTNLTNQVTTNPNFLPTKTAEVDLKTENESTFKLAPTPAQLGTAPLQKRQSSGT